MAIFTPFIQHYHMPNSISPSGSAAPLPNLHSLFPKPMRSSSFRTSLPSLWNIVDPQGRAMQSNVARNLMRSYERAAVNTKRSDSYVTKTRKPLSLRDLLSNDEPNLGPRTKSNVHHRRQCGVTDCFKYALSGGYCIRHGGGKRCNFQGCQTVAQSGGLCKAHGGGSKCKVLHCNNVARRKGFCMGHGGRQPCKMDGCTKCAHGGGFCISHGGGKRCSSQDCMKSAQAGGFCYSHGGGKRCSAPECFQAARKGGLCIRHRKANEDSDTVSSSGSPMSFASGTCL